MTDKNEDEFFSDEEATRRRDEVIRRMVNTPPQPRVSPKSGQKKAKPTGGGRKPRKSASNPNAG